MRFSKDDVKVILSQDHLNNTAFSLQKESTDVTADELINHYLKFHLPMTIMDFEVLEPQHQGDTSDLSDPLFI